MDVAREAGITRVVLSGRPGKDHLLDSAGTGVAWLDYDRDGRLDAYIVNGWRLEGDRVAEKGRNALYRNRGDGTFEDVTDRAGVAGEGHWGSGVAVADYDGDGRPDLLVTNFGPNVLYRNRGNGTFENVAGKAGIEVPGWNTGAAFFDADGDGDLDLYIAGYVDCTLEEVLRAKPVLDWKGVERVAVGPFGLPGAPDHFFLSDGKGRFREATGEAGLTDKGLGYGFAVRAADFDRTATWTSTWRTIRIRITCTGTRERGSSGRWASGPARPSAPAERPRREWASRWAITTATPSSTSS